MTPDEDRARDEIALNPNFRKNEGALLRALLQATDYGILLTGLDRQDILANQRMGELFSYAPQLIVQSDPDAVRKEALARVKAPGAFEETLRMAYADPSTTFEDELVLADEPPRTLRRFTGPVLDQSGNPIARLWTFLDITENKRLNDEVAAQLEARTRDFEATRELLQAMNDMCRLASYNRGKQDLLALVTDRLGSLHGLNGAAVLVEEHDGKVTGSVFLRGGQSVGVAMPPETERTLTALMAGSLVERGGSPDRLHREAGLQKLLNSDQLCVLPLRGDSATIGLLVLALDRNAEIREDNLYHGEQLEALADQVAQTLETHRLQSRLRNTVQSLQDTQLRLVEMEKLHTAGELAASVAHDIRNILSTLQLELDLLPGTAEPLRNQLTRFSALTHRLLAYARPSVLELRPTSIPFVIDRLMPLLKTQTDAHHVEIRVCTKGSIPEVPADENQIEHLFVNLSLNAIHAMTERGGELTITLADAGEWLKVTIEDTGRGIGEDAMPRLFDAFFTTRATGFGLGLFSCKRIVEEHGGHIQAENRPGGGACFTVKLPALPARERESTTMHRSGGRE